jgi:protein-S-isoprenylcysteine O-methyltransferase Ste14
MTLLIKTLVSIVVSFLFMALIMFLPAGTLLWPAGWICLILLFIYTLVNIGMLYTSSPALLEERFSLSQPNQKSWDKALMPVFFLLCLAWAILMPLDAVRFHWSHVPLFLQIIGAIGLIASFPIMILTFRENTFLSPTVRLQQERGQTVISSGPYHYVRHPLYAGGLLLFLATPLLLGSWYGVLLSLVLIAAMGLRAVLEERVLRQELPGYDAYMAQVKYRFIPYVW